MRFISLLALASIVSPGTLSAQDYRETTRDTYTFLGHNLVIEVLTEAPGMLRVMRGDPGEVRVLARARDGFAGYSMAGYTREKLHLTSVGAERVDYLVIVPGDTRVDVRLPNHMYPQSLGTLQKASTYRWGATPETAAMAAAPAQPATPAPAAAAARPGANTEVAYSSASAPRMVAIFGPAVRQATVRIEEGRFRVSSPSVLEVIPAGTGLLDIRASDPADIAIAVPSSTREFVLRLDNQPVLMIRNGVARSLCLGITEQKLSGGRHWFTVSPATASECRTPGF